MKHAAELVATLDRLGLAAHVDRLARYATVELALIADPAGGSRIGGAPELPADLPWPARRWPLAEIAGWPAEARALVDISRDRSQAWVDGDELVMPLPFVLQLDLAELGALDRRLPARGVLACFASVTSDIEDPDLAKRVAATVLHFPDRDALVARPHPPTYDDPPAHAVALRAERAIAWDVPYDDRPELEGLLGERGLKKLLDASAGDRHAVFPAAREECVGPMPPPGELALLRVVDDDTAGFRVGDASWITWVISELDLRARRFERARATVFIG